MQIEYEATFENIDKGEIKERLEKAGAKLVRPEFMQKRVTLQLPKGQDAPNKWLRVRDEGDRITMTFKHFDGDNIDNQKELLIVVDSFEKTVEFLLHIGCIEKSYQESRRELWTLDGAEITIDEWPFLDPFVEVEGKNEKEVRDISEKLGFNWENALFCAVGHQYERKYGVAEDYFNSKISKVTFDMENPFTDIKA
ncbi:MAG: CYTH domain-containing protein [Parcubacteria group bacterium]|jgi:adenylate cyclase class 2